MEEQAIRIRPILFSAQMVRALLAGTKTQTRRPVKSRKDPEFGCEMAPGEIAGDQNPGRLCPYGQPGDRLWVRETFMDMLGTGVEHRHDPRGLLQRYAYAADHQPGSYGDEARKSYGLKWKPSIHMPRAASRITLEITSVRVERLQNISESDAQAEGCALECMTPTGDDNGSAIYGLGGYLALWESINGAGSWNMNPWVWVVEFKRVEGCAA